MAYQVATGVANDTGALLVKLRDFVITTLGWTSLQDTVTNGANGQYFAARSLGEGGTERTVLRFFRTTANTISVLGYLNWSAGVGTQAIGSTSGTTGTGTFLQTDDDDFIQYWFFGSLDRIVLCSRTTNLVGRMSTVYAGLYDRARSATVTATTNGPAAGANVVITMAATAWATVGRYYSIADDTAFEWFKVTAINPGVSVTAEALINTYAVGARVGEDPRPCLITVENPVLGMYSINNYLSCPPWRRIAMTQGMVGVRGLDGSFERAGLDRGIGDKVLLWPFVILDESPLGGGFAGKMREVFYCSREGLATDDTIAIGGSTYRVIVPAAQVVSPSAATSAVMAVQNSVALAVRQA